MVKMNIEKSFGDVVDKTKESLNHFDPDKRIEQFKDTVVEGIKDIFDPDRRKDEFNSTEAERMRFTPTEETGRGTWEGGSRGNGIFVPNRNTEEGLKVSNELAKYGLEGIKYKDGIPDFKDCCSEMVTIDLMTHNRDGHGGNFAQADVKLAKQWNDTCKDGRSDWTARQIKEYRVDNHLTWHECSDLKTCMLVDTSIHSYFPHSGGVFEYNKGLNNDDGGIFDE